MIPVKYFLVGVLFFCFTLSCQQENNERENSQVSMQVFELIENWVAMWNSYDLSEVKKLFINSEKLSYFSSEKEGVLKGFDAIVSHHAGFGFVEGGKVQENKLWLEDIEIDVFPSTAIVTAIWYFEKPAAAEEAVQRGPVTFVCIRDGDDYTFAHMNFSEYAGH